MRSLTVQRFLLIFSFISLLFTPIQGFNELNLLEGRNGGGEVSTSLFEDIMCAFNPSFSEFRHCNSNGLGDIIVNRFFNPNSNVDEDVSGNGGQRKLRGAQ
ncbi:expressed unknown protein [Seminavis robusta]|uniref:Uncharacterized protein n=1 Tax=Seminavis robusta TaxID=568900 RepID=A0A9N8HRQ2_9STRA|nr:expressed unknown protein [Seminavis robusta]|eukprot:Sro1425_g271580.1 n/a (101) ;mRNA; f:17316-17618